MDAVSTNMTLLDQASRNVVSLLARHQQLQAHIRQLDAWSKAQVEAAETAADRAREDVAAADARVRAMQEALEAMRHRAEAAERALERDSSTLETLQARIIAAFGFGAGPQDGFGSVRTA